ncbi:MAG: DUF3617 family protein [Asticcacaulis sp.]|nr:DUF3617 family protein [Asticcacaulis sp.]
MRNYAFGLCLVTAFLALSACSKSKTAEDGGATVEAPAAAPAEADPTAALNNGPGLKAGLGQMTTSVKGMTSGLVTKMCLDEGLSHKFGEMGTSNPGKLDCSPVSASRNGNVIDVTTVCKADQMSVNNQMHMEITGDGSYHQTVTQTYTPAMMEPTVSTIDGKYLGACPADMKAGDMALPGGRTINMYDHKAR